MSLEGEIRKVQERQRVAMDAQASSGSTAEGVLAAGLRAGFEHALETIEPDLSRMEAAVGVSLDGASFFLGMQCAACMQEGVNALDMASHPVSGPLLREYAVRMRQRHEEAP